MFRSEMIPSPLWRSECTNISVLIQCRILLDSHTAELLYSLDPSVTLSNIKIGSAVNSSNRIQYCTQASLITSYYMRKIPFKLCLLMLSKQKEQRLEEKRNDINNFIQENKHNHEMKYRLKNACWNS